MMLSTLLQCCIVIAMQIKLTVVVVESRDCLSKIRLYGDARMSVKTRVC